VWYAACSSLLRCFPCQNDTQPQQPNLVMLHASAFLAIFPTKKFDEAQKLLKFSIAG
jgi:hypothetical protein